MNVGVILSGGVGARYGSDIPKQYLIIKNKQVIAYPITALKECDSIDVVVVACDKKYQTNIMDEYNVLVCDSGKDRNETVYNALCYVRKKFDCEKIVFVDAARPLLKSNDVSNVLKMLDEEPSVVTCAPVTDSLGRGDKIVCRKNYYLVQTPEAFRMDELDYFDPQNVSCTTIVEQAKTKKIGKYFGMVRNFKITYNGDLKILESLMEEK